MYDDCTLACIRKKGNQTLASSRALDKYLK